MWSRLYRTLCCLLTKVSTVSGMLSAPGALGTAPGISGGQVSRSPPGQGGVRSCHRLLGSQEEGPARTCGQVTLGTWLMVSPPWPGDVKPCRAGEQERGGLIRQSFVGGQ